MSEEKVLKVNLYPDNIRELWLERKLKSSNSFTVEAGCGTDSFLNMCGYIHHKDFGAIKTSYSGGSVALAVSKLSADLKQMDGVLDKYIKKIVFSRRKNGKFKANIYLE